MDPLVENLGKWVRIVFVMFTGRCAKVRLFQNISAKDRCQEFQKTKDWGGSLRFTSLLPLEMCVVLLGGVLGWTGFELFAMMNIITACFVDSVP